MAVIAVFNQKGGVGKTTTCLNVAAVPSQAKQHPFVLDMIRKVTSAWPAD